MKARAKEHAAEAAYGDGLIAEQQVRLVDAAEAYAEAARLAPNWDRLKKARAFLWRAGDLAGALRAGKDLIAAALAEAGAGSARHATALNEHAQTLHAAGFYRQAEPLFRQTIEIGAPTIGTGHPDHATPLNNLAVLLAETGRAEEAEPLYREALAITREALGKRHPHTAASLNNTASLPARTGRPEEAGPLFAEAVATLREALGDAHPWTRRIAGNHARFLAGGGTDAERAALDRLEAAFGPDVAELR